MMDATLPEQMTVVDTHTAGEPTRIWVGGCLGAPGKTMAERRVWLRSNFDHLRTFLMQEPRGHRGMSGAIVGPPCDPAADIGIVYMDNYRYMPMCGHATIGVVTALAELGHLSPAGEENRLLLDTPAGQVKVRYRWSEGKVTEVSFRNVCSYHIVRASVDVRPWGTIPFDVAYGGNVFVLVSLEDLPLTISPERLPELRDAATEILRRVDRETTITDPITGETLRAVWLEFYDEHSNPPRNVVLGAPTSEEGNALLRCNKVDRSPCGTGLSAKLATLYSRGTLEIGETYRYQSIIGTEFRGTILETCQAGDAVGIVPEIFGSAHVIGIHTLFAAGGDPFRKGFLLPEG